MSTLTTVDPVTSSLPRSSLTSKIPVATKTTWANKRTDSVIDWASTSVEDSPITVVARNKSIQNGRVLVSLQQQQYNHYLLKFLKTIKLLNHLKNLR